MKNTPTDRLTIHPAADLFPLMTAEEFQALKEDIRQYGQRERIVLFEGMILDGRHRYRACLELGLSPRTVSIERDVVGDPVSYVCSVNLHRRHLTAKQRRDVIASVLKASPQQSNRQVAAKLGVDHKTVGAVRRQQEAGGEIPHLETTDGADGKRYKAGKKQAQPSSPPAAEAATARAGGETAEP